MKRRYTAQGIKVNRRFLNVQVRVDVGAVTRWTTVAVPLRLLNEQYEALANAMAAEATERAKEQWDVPMLPLEKWE